MSKRTPSKNRRLRRHRGPIRTSIVFEDFSSEIFYEIFDYLSGNEIYKAFFGLNSRFKELVWNKPNIQLNLSRTKTKLYRGFQNIFALKNIRSVMLLYKNVDLLETVFNSMDVTCLRSISLLAVPLKAFETEISEILEPFRNQLISLKIQFDDMNYKKTGALAAVSFAQLLTDFAYLKYLSLTYPYGIDDITYLFSDAINNTIINLTIALRDERRLIPLLYHFARLKVLNIESPINIPRKRIAPRDDVLYYRQLLREKTSFDYPIHIRQINAYNYPMALKRFEQLFTVVLLPSVVILNLFTCQHSWYYQGHMRPPLWLDGPGWHQLLQRILPSTLKQLYVEYQNVNSKILITDLPRIQREFDKQCRIDSRWSVSCGFNQVTNLLSLRFCSTSSI